MTADQLRTHFNNTFGLGEWPRVYEVDAETYGNCCQAVFDWLMKPENVEEYQYNYCKISLGISNGLMFKGIELLIKK